MDIIDGTDMTDAIIESAAILPFIQFKLFFLEKGELKLKKNKKFIWYLNNED